MHMHTPAVLVMSAALLSPKPAAAQQAAPPAQPAAARPSVAWLDLQRIVESSAEGKIANAKVQALSQKKQNEIGEKGKQLQTAQQKLQTSGSVLNDDARGVLEKEVDKLNLEIQRLQQDAQAEIQELQMQLQNEFQKKLMPVIETVVKERNIALLFSRNDAGIVYGDPGLDLTDEIVKRFDATAAGTPKPAAAPPSTTQKPPAGGQTAPAANPPSTTQKPPAGQTPPAGNPPGR